MENSIRNIAGPIGPVKLYNGIQTPTEMMMNPVIFAKFSASTGDDVTDLQT